MLLRHYLEEGRRKGAIARTLGISRDTIHRPIRNAEPDRSLDEEPVRYKGAPAVAMRDTPGLATCFRPSDFRPVPAKRIAAGRCPPRREQLKWLT